MPKPSTPPTNPFTTTLVRTLQNLYPPALADSSFDNTGLLLEAPWDPLNAGPQGYGFRKGEPKVLGAGGNRVLLCVDLTGAVAEEAVGEGVAVVVAYHPIIFRPLKSITSQDSQQRSLLKLAANGISVYSPHTAVDAAIGGNADWLADILTMREETLNAAAHKTSTRTCEDEVSTNTHRFELHDFPKRGISLDKGCEPHFRCPITPSQHSADAGFGRFVRLDSPTPLSLLLGKLTTGLGDPRAFSIALPHGVRAESMQIRTIGICAGSGGSVIAKSAEKPDLLVTGEMSHHETLAAVELGQVVVCLGHSNSERGYLDAVMRHSLKSALDGEWARAREEFTTAEWFLKIKDEWQELLTSDETHVQVSERDEDPFKTLISYPHARLPAEQ